MNAELLIIEQSSINASGEQGNLYRTKYITIYIGMNKTSSNEKDKG
jgi:hypothetical protein